MPGRKKDSPDLTRRHRFESFSQRIANLKVDPVHQVRRQPEDIDALSLTPSFFYDALDRWRDTNTSRSFTQFVREVSPLCSNLPQILHFEDRIVDLIVRYIELKDVLSLEPLLDLLVQFARDLGTRSEKHFERTVGLVLSLAAHHPDIEVIEWSFICLAWLLKFLSRLLVADLRPTFDLMAPFLGREPQKPFVLRFAAEAMSHLVRKAANTNRKEAEPLERLVTHAFANLHHSKDLATFKSYQQGLTQLFSNAAKGVKDVVHSCAYPLLRCMLECLRTNGPEYSGSGDYVFLGTVISLIQHAEVDDSHPVVLLIQEATAESFQGLVRNVRIAGKLLIVAAGVKNGSRVSDWTPLLDNLTGLLKMLHTNANFDHTAIWQVYEGSALILQRAPSELVLPRYRVILDQLMNEPFGHYILPFCYVFATLGTDRFQSLVVPYLERFIVKHWTDREDNLCVLLPKLADLGCIGRPAAANFSLSCPQAWQEHIVDTLESTTTSSDGPDKAGFASSNHISTVQAYLEILRVMKSDISIRNRIQDRVQSLLRSALEHDVLDDCTAKFAVGKGFIHYVHDAETSKTIDTSLWPRLCTSGARFATLPLFLQGLVGYIGKTPSLLKDEGVTSSPLVEALQQNLSSPSHIARSLSLSILKQLYSITRKQESELLSVALLIEDTPLNLENARKIAMHIRRLGEGYRSVASQSCLSKALPLFCCGMLNITSSQLEKEVVAVLVNVANSNVGEEVIAEVAFSWLQHPSYLPTPKEPGIEGFKKPITEAEDPSLIRLDKTISQITWELEHAQEVLQRAYGNAHSESPLRAMDARSQALRALQQVPKLAERRSRLLVPLFLDCFNKDEEVLQEYLPDTPAANGGESTRRWLRNEKVAMLNIFAKFSNPKALYKSSEVYDILLGLLANGDVEVQKTSLEAILTWANPSIEPYKEHLRNLLDDARFKDEIASLLQTSRSENSINPVHRNDVMPVLLRLLFGKTIARKGTSSGKKGMEGNRRLILKSLAELPLDELRLFIQIAISPLDGPITLRSDADIEKLLAEHRLSFKRQAGLLNMIADMAYVLGIKLLPFTEELLQPVLYCIIRATYALDEHDSEDSFIPAEGCQSTTVKSVRQMGYRCLNSLFTSCAGFDWHPYMQTIYLYVVDPRLEKLPIETAQSPSSLLQLLGTWFRSIDTALDSAEYNSGLIAKIADCVAVPSAKEEVRLFALAVIRDAVELVSGSDELLQTRRDLLRTKILRPNVNVLIARVGAVLRSNPGKDLLEAAVGLLTRLTDFVTDVPDVRSLLDISVYLLNQPLRVINARIKVGLVQMVRKYLPLSRIHEDEELEQGLFTTISCLFNFFIDRESRENLCHILGLLGQSISGLDEIITLCHDLNSYNPRRIDEPDFDRRLKAFDIVSRCRLENVRVALWTPILYNLLFFMRDSEGFALRTNSSYALRQLIGSNPLTTVGHEELLSHLSQIIMPALRTGVKETSELIRVEYVNLMAEVAQKFPSYDEVGGMDVLLANADQEASFFNNILHIQQHRRLRALRRLAIEVQQGRLGSKSICQFLIPLIEHFIIQEKEDEAMHNLAAQAVSTMGELLEWIDWSQFRALLKRYIRRFQESTEPEKVVIKLLGAMADALGKAVNSEANNAGIGASGASPARVADISPDTNVIDPAALKPGNRLSLKLPSREGLAEVLTSKSFLPCLSSFLRNKDESLVSIRVPVAVIVIKFLSLLPSDQLSVHLPPVLTDLCHILRSRAPEPRDMTRKTLADIIIILGPTCFAFLVKELRSALTRGYQLHVLSFTLHSLLVAGSPHFRKGDIDYCLQPIVEIIMNDIFGVVGEEKDAADYISGMKEVKQRKSFDSMELITKISTLPSLPILLRPIQAVLQQNLNITSLRKVDELLRRISSGISQNEALQNQGLLVFCYEVLKEATVLTASNAKAQVTGTYRTQRYIISLKAANKHDTPSSATSCQAKLARFSLDILRTTLTKQDSLRTAANITGLVPLINDALLNAQAEVRVSALRLLLVILKVPLPDIDRNLGIYVAEAVESVKASPATDTELAQASIKLVAAILRERRDFDLDEAKIKPRIGYLLQRVKSDLEEPNRQGVSFTFLKAVLSRKILVPEVYEVLDTVASIMVTNQTREARDLARGVYFQFLMEYPQGKARFTKQLSFLVKNLEYKHPEGRQSVLEVIHLLISKVGADLVQEILGTFMVPLVMVLLNDDSSECREMAGTLLGEVFRGADNEKMQSFLSLLRKWINLDGNPLLVRAALQCYGFYLDAQAVEGRSEISLIHTRIRQIVSQDIPEVEEGEWELMYRALQLLSKICQVFPETAFSSSFATSWSAVASSLAYPHFWVRLSAAKLIGAYLADFVRANSGNGLEKLPFVGSHGLLLDGNMMLSLTHQNLGILDVQGVPEELAMQAVRNLVFLGRSLGANGAMWTLADTGTTELEHGQDALPSEESEDDNQSSRNRSAIQYLFGRLSLTLRRELLGPKKESLVPKTASLQLVAALCNHLSPSTLRISISSILLPLHHLIDESIPMPYSTDPDFNGNYKALRSISYEIIALLQQKLGTTELVAEHMKVKESVREKREDRRRKRRIEVITEPDKMQRKKQKKEERKKVKRKEKSADQRGRRRGW